MKYTCIGLVLLLVVTAFACNKYPNYNKTDAMLGWKDPALPASDSICGYYLRVGLSPYFSYYKISNEEVISSFPKIAQQDVTVEFEKLNKYIFYKCGLGVGAEQQFGLAGIRLISISKR